jgi:alpha-1,6-mannosyltransferase
MGKGGNTAADGNGKSVSITPSRRLYGLGAILLVALTICAQNGATGEPSSIIPLAIAGIAYFFALREFFSSTVPKRVIVAGLVMAALWQLPFLLKAPRPDDDIHRYVWDGRLQRLGYNPYVVIPSSPAAVELHTPETRTLNNPDLPSPYPPAAELFFRAVTAIHESVFALKVAFVICDFVIALLLLDVLRRSGRGEHWVLAYAWNPLLAAEVAGSGHVDIVGALLLLASAAALARRWRAFAAITFALAVAVKFLPIVLLPLYWKRVRVRDGVLGALVFGLLYLPFLHNGHLPLGSLGTFIQSFRFNDPVFAALERVAAPQLLAALAVLVGILTSIWLRSKSQERFSDAFAWPIATSLLFAPVVYPWYLLWMLPFLQSVSTVPIMIWSVSIIPTYYVWHLRAVGRPWAVPESILLLEYGSAAAAAVIVALRRPGQAAGTRNRTDQTGES